METKQLRIIRKTKTVTRTYSKEVDLKWTIIDFSGDGSIYSPTFEIDLISECTKWQVYLHLKKSKKSFVDIYLRKSGHPSIFLDVDILLRNTRGKNLDSLAARKLELTQGSYSRILSNTAWNSKLPMISCDGKLVLLIKLMAYVNGEPAELKTESSQSSSNLQSSIIHDLAKLRIEPEFSDFTISVQGFKFHAHKNILAARSPVFSSMFKHKMKEANLGQVEIEDMEPIIFKEFLDFIYTGKANISNAGLLLAAADKYNVRDLKEFCEDALIKNLNKQNCFTTLSLADLHAAKKLKKEAIKFIVSNNGLLDKKGLAQIRNLSLSKELIEALLIQKK